MIIDLVHVLLVMFLSMNCPLNITQPWLGSSKLLKPNKQTPIIFKVYGKER